MMKDRDDLGDGLGDVLRRPDALPVGGQEFGQAGLLDGGLPPVDGSDLRGVGVRADHKEAFGGEAGQHRRAELAEADHGHSIGRHRLSLQVVMARPSRCRAGRAARISRRRPRAG